MNLFAKKARAPLYVVRRMRVVGRARVHMYLMHPRHRGQFKWGSYLKAAVYTTFENAKAAVHELRIDGDFQIVPVGYEGPPYWESKTHVQWQGSMAKYRNPRVFLVDAQGKRIEV